MKIKTIALSALCLLIAPATLIAQEWGAEQAQPPAAVADIPAERMEATAKAYVEILQVQEKHQPKLQGVSDPEEAQAIQQRANADMEKAIEMNRLSVTEYNETMRDVNSSGELQQKFLNKVNKLQNGGQAGATY